MRLTEDSLREPVTQHMRREYPVIHPEHTIEEALAYLRKHPPEGRIVYFYVVDADHRLQGVIPTRRLLLAQPDQRIQDIMITRVVAIPAAATVLEACEFFSLHQFLAFPIVDEFRRVLGVIDVELYTEELSEVSESGRHDRDLFQIFGLTLSEAQQANPLRAFRGRFPWLLCNVGGGILAAFLSGVFQDVLGWKQAVLALFIPVVLALAESVSIQSVTLALESIHMRQPTWGSLLGKLRSELQTGVLLGLGVGILVASVAFLWQGSMVLLWCILGGILGGVTVAALIGVAIPNLLRLLKCDPQVAAGPIALALADMLTLLIYFNLARLLI